MKGLEVNVEAPVDIKVQDHGQTSIITFRVGFTKVLMCLTPITLTALVHHMNSVELLQTLKKFLRERMAQWLQCWPVIWEVGAQFPASSQISFVTKLLHRTECLYKFLLKELP